MLEWETTPDTLKLSINGYEYNHLLAEQIPAE